MIYDATTTRSVTVYFDATGAPLLDTCGQCYLEFWIEKEKGNDSETTK